MSAFGLLFQLLAKFSPQGARNNAEKRLFRSYQQAFPNVSAGDRWASPRTMRYHQWILLAWWPALTSSWGEDWWTSASSSTQAGPLPPPGHRAGQTYGADGRQAYSSHAPFGNHLHQAHSRHPHQHAPAHVFAGDGHGAEVGLRGASKEVRWSHDRALA